MKIPAKWWTPLADGRLRCDLCPRYCKIPDGKHGFCFVRRNDGGQMYLTAYGSPTGFAVDPIEKKPLNHFLPGTPILSFGTAGCNLGCRFCQNWHISKAKLEDARAMEFTPQQIVDLAIRRGCPSIAYTYNDPTIYGEFVIDVSRLARKAGLKNVMVTAGYITPEARKEVYQHIDAANIDLKAFTDEFYFKLTFANLEPVLNTIKWLVNETDVWVELTTLLIPGKNDSEDEIINLSQWVKANCGDNVPLHFTAFHPDFKMIDTPPTAPGTLTRSRNIALEAGLHYVYTGNVINPDGQATYCPGCGMKVIERNWHTVTKNSLKEGKCGCGTKIKGHFQNN